MFPSSITLPNKAPSQPAITAPSAALLNLLLDNQPPLPHKAKGIAPPRTISIDAVSMKSANLRDRQIGKKQNYRYSYQDTFIHDSAFLIKLIFPPE